MGVGVNRDGSSRLKFSEKIKRKKMKRKGRMGFGELQVLLTQASIR